MSAPPSPPNEPPPEAEEAEKKPLYLGKSLEDLDKETVVTSVSKDRTLEQLCKAADKIWQSTKHETYDEERAYILHVRYLKMLKLIGQRTEDRKFMMSRFGRSMELATEQMEILQVSLQERYRDQNGTTTETTETTTTDTSSSSEDYEDTKEEEEFCLKYLLNDSYTTSKQVYQMIEDKIDILVMDVRQPQHFRNSQMRSVTHVNIDPAYITLGNSARTLGRQLTDVNWKLYEKRHTCKLVILMDYNSNAYTNERTKVTVLRSILGFDVKKCYPVILSGGYQDWVDKYPSKSTNPAYVLEEFAQPVEFMAIDYPTFDIDPQTRELIVVDRTTKPVYVKPVSQQPIMELETDLDEIYSASAEERSVASLIADQPPENYDERMSVLRDLSNAGREYAEQRYIALRDLYHYRTEFDTLTREGREWAGMNKLEQLVVDVQTSERHGADIQKRRNEFCDKYNLPCKLGQVVDRQMLPEEPMVKIDPQAMRFNALSRSLLDSDKVYFSCCVEYIDKWRARRIAQKMQPRIPDRGKKPVLIGQSRIPPIKLQQIQCCLTGLTNQRNNCYLNATVQCLRHVPSLVEYIFTGSYSQDLIFNPTLAHHFVDIVKQLWQNGDSRQPVKVANLYAAMLREFSSSFVENRHEDGLECFTLLFTRLSEETDRPMDVDTQLRFYHADEIEQWMEAHCRRYSFFIRHFYSQLQRVRECSKCTRKRITYDHNNVIMLPMPEDRSNMDLQEALTEYMQEEEAGKIMCGHCKLYGVERKTIKYYPEVLVISIKRYYENEKSTYSRCNSLCYYKDNDFALGPHKYRLIAVMMHSGTLTSGHYTAVCKNPVNERWYLYNDGEVSLVNSVHTSDFRTKSYVFFYVYDGDLRDLNPYYARL